MRLELGWTPFLSHQREAFRWSPKGDLGILAILGGWGSGKSHAAARCVVRWACTHGWHSGYGSSQPIGLIVAPTHKVLMQATLTQLNSVLPHQLVRKRRAAPFHDIELVNGFKFLLHSGEAQVEGMDACLVWIDEVHKPIFASNPNRYLNLLARLRDPLTQAPKMMIASGLPEAGWVRDTFDADSPTRRTILCSTKSNPHIDQSLLDEFYAACPSGHEQTLLGGQWRSPDGAVYAQFDAGTHLTEARGSPGAPCTIAIDIGDKGAILVAQSEDVAVRNVVGQTSKDKGLLVVDQMITHHASVDEMCYRLKTGTPWRIIPGHSAICVDPTSRRDELAVLRKHFPGVRIVKWEQGDEYYPIEAGVRATQRALRDALSNVRIRIWKGLSSEPAGLVDALQRYRRNQQTGVVMKDNRTDHVVDCLRYLVCHLLPGAKLQSRTVQC